MKNKFLYFLVFIFLNIYAQDERRLLSIADTNISIDDFLKNYHKNKLETDTLSFTESLDEYLDLYIKFQLKVIEAKNLGLDTVPSFIRELSGYRKQLVKPYLTDNTVSDQLLKEAYDRLKYEVSVSHILIRHDDTDTTVAYNKALSVQKKLKNGADFVSLAKQVSEDPSVKENNGDLGYFSALYMVYPFESAAYNTPVGSISDIVKTRFGYHILKINDKRPSRGEVKVAHILIKNPSQNKTDLKINAQNKINEIYDSLVLGFDFSALAKKYSDDKKSGSQGGELDWFGANKMVKEFEEIAFNLESIDAFSKPFQTEFGWHIIKLLDKKNLPPFAEIQESLKQKVERDSRSQKTRDVVLNRLKKEWGFVEDVSAINIFYRLINEDFISGDDLSKKIPGKGRVMFLFNNQYDESQRYVFQEDFIQFLNSFRSRIKQQTDFNHVVDQLYTTFKEQIILELESSNLEYKYDDFKLLYNEYHDGILMYQLQKEKVWDKAIIDTLGLTTFYNENKLNYIWPNRVRAKIYSCKDVRIYNKVNRKLNWGIEDSVLLSDVNRTSTLNLAITDSVFSQGDNELIDKHVFSLDWDLIQKSDVILCDNNKIIYVVDLLPSSHQLLEEIKGLVISDYQSFLETEWLSELAKKHTIVINDSLFNLAKNNQLTLESTEISFPLYKSFNSIFATTVKKLGASSNTFFGWKGKIYNTQIN